jgi:hypothetical protein
MSPAAVLAPVFVQVVLTFVLLFWMARGRLGALKRGEMKDSPRNLAPRELAWPKPVKQVQDCFHNQFEMPVLFYALVALAMMTRQADLLFVVMAWLFVATRLAHAYFHTGANILRQRFTAYTAGVFVLMAMWAIFAVRILLLS